MGVDTRCSKHQKIEVGKKGKTYWNGGKNFPYSLNERLNERKEDTKARYLSVFEIYLAKRKEKSAS